MATIKDVARESGLSVTTVSRILNNRGYISESARARVDDAMKRLNYHPNELARSLSMSHSNMVALIVPHIRHPYFAVLISELEEAIRELGYQMLLFNTKRSEDTLERYLEICQENRVSGIILCSAQVNAEVLERLNAPIVTIERYAEKAASNVSCDNENGGRIAADRLIRSGCRNLLCVSGSSGQMMPGDLRTIMFQRVCQERQVACNMVYLPEEAFTNNDYTESLEAIYAAYDSTHPEEFYDGMFISGDVIAAEAVRLAIRHGIRVPEDLQIIGFDDTIISQIGTPDLTTIHQPIREMAQSAVTMLDRAMNGKRTMPNVVHPVHLVERQSTRQMTDRVR